MKSVAKLVYLYGIIAIIFCSCAEIEPTFKLRKTPVASDELRLLSMQVAETIGEDLPYEVVFTFEALGEPHIRRVCFRWLSGKASVPSPSLYCYSWEAQTDKGIDSACTRWLAEGPYAESSPLFCANVENIQYGRPGQFTAKIRAQNVEQFYNELEAYAEYRRGEESDISNKIRTRIRVEKLGQ